jgi:hypothetical protein
MYSVALTARAAFDIAVTNHRLKQITGDEDVPQSGGGEKHLDVVSGQRKRKEPSHPSVEEGCGLPRSVTSFHDDES